VAYILKKTHPLQHLATVVCVYNANISIGYWQ